MKGNEKILVKTPLTTQQTFIEFATEYKEEFNRLEAAGNDHMIFTNRASIPGMKVLVGTQKVFQLQGDLNSNLNLNTSYIPCSCPPFRMDISDVLS